VFSETRIPCRGGLEHLYSRSAICRRRRKWNPVPGGTTGPPCHYLSIYLSMAVQPSVWPWSLFSFLISYIVGRTPWTRDQFAARPLSAYWAAQTQNKCTQPSMSQVGFELTIPVFQRAKTVHAFNSAASVSAHRVTGGINTDTWSSRLRVGRNVDDLPM
jgi:hypothetical protein